MEKMITLTPSAFRVEFPWNAGGMGLCGRLLTKNLTAFPPPRPLFLDCSKNSTTMKVGLPFLGLALWCKRNTILDCDYLKPDTVNPNGLRLSRRENMGGIRHGNIAEACERSQVFSFRSG